MASTITFSDGNLGRRNPSSDATAALFFLHTHTAAAQHRIFSLQEAEELGFTQAQDLADNTLVWFHIREFYRRAPGRELHICFTDHEDLTNAELRAWLDTVIRALNGSLRLIALCGNRAPATWTQLLADLATELNAQAAANRFVTCLLEGADFWPAAGNKGAVPALANTQSRLALVVGKDNSQLAYEEEVGATYSGAAIGTILGLCAAARVNQSIGEVAAFPLGDGEAFTTAYLSGDKPYAALTDTQRATLAADRIIYLLTYVGQAGLYVNLDPTRATLASDYALLARRRVADKIARLAYTGQLQFVQSNLAITAAGRIAPESIAIIETALRQTIEREMVTTNELSSILISIDPTQDILATDELVIDYIATPTGRADLIRGQIRYNNPNNA